MLLLLIAAGGAHAQNAEAELLFGDGDRLFAAGLYPAACEAFEASNRIEPRAGTLIRLGACRERNGQLASAWAAYASALERVKDARKQRIASAQLNRLGPRLSHLTIAVVADHRVGGLTVRRNGEVVEPSQWNRAVPVDGGPYRIEVEAPGRRPWSQNIDVARERARAIVEVPRLVEELPGLTAPSAEIRPRPVPSPRPAPVLTVGTIPRGERETPARRPSGLTGQRKLALGLTVVAAGAAGAGVALGMAARDLESQAHDRCPTLQCADHAAANALLDRSHSRVRYANIAFATAGGVAVGAAVLWFTGGRHTVVPEVGRDHAGIAAVGRF